MNTEAKKIARKLKIDYRVQQFHEAEAFITVKDHKDNFPKFSTFRLINPSKSEIGKISKPIPYKINNASVDQAFVIFDVENFYPSISEKLLTDAISYAKSFIDITDEEYSLIMHSRNILLFQNSELWVKKDGNEDFDVPMVVTMERRFVSFSVLLFSTNQDQ